MPRVEFQEKQRNKNPKEQINQKADKDSKTGNKKKMQPGKQPPIRTKHHNIECGLIGKREPDEPTKRAQNQGNNKGN